MKLRIQLLHRGEAVKECLRRDGWKLEAETIHSLFACHPHVESQAGARQRVHELGLLTSGTLRIEFLLVPLPPPAGSSAPIPPR